MLIAEDLLLLLTDDVRGRLVVASEQVDIALGGALLVELSLSERVALDERGRVRVADAVPTGDPLLEHALEVVAGRQGKKPGSVVGPLGKKVRPALYERLVEGGLLRKGKGKVLGLFPVRTWPALDVHHEAAVRDAVTQALVVGTTPEPRTAALIGLLRATRATHKVVPPKDHGLSRRELDSRAKAVAEGDWAAKAVREAIDAVNAAVAVAVAATGASGAAGG
ncbi:MAG: GOLPH3/VPS74 family protein [Nocardioidaceae bacterium]